MTAATAGDTYRDIWKRSIESKDAFWLEAARSIDWTVFPTTGVDTSISPSGRWFADGELNTCFNALDRHVLAGHGDRIAVHFDSAMTGDRISLTYAELLVRVARFAGALRERGVGKGDRVVLYMPMIPEAVVAMLACARLGAVHSVVFGGFAASELAARIDDSDAVVLVTASGGKEPGKEVDYLAIVERALTESAGSVHTVIVHERPGMKRVADVQSAAEEWLTWTQAEAGIVGVDPVPVAATDPLYVLYTSGTTGKPKGIVRDNGGHAVALAWSMRAIYGVHAGNVMWTASDVGWVVGHSYIVYGPLLAGATTVLYEGKPVGTPDAGVFWRVIQDYRVEVMFTAPTAARAVRREDPSLSLQGAYDISSLRALFLAGERLDPETFLWLQSAFDGPVVDHWWQTETGWAICANLLGIERMPLKAGSASLPVPGYDVRILDGSGIEVDQTGVDGNICIRLPLPPGSMAAIWGDPNRMRDAYLKAFDGYYTTGDSGFVDDDGYVFVMGRTDDVINVAGHRLSTGSLEQVLAQHPAVAEAAVIGVRDDLKGQRASGFVTLKAGATVDVATLQRELVSLVRDQVGPVAAFRDVTVLRKLPKTRSGKVLRNTMRQIVDGEEYAVPPTIEDPSALGELQQQIAARVD